MKYILILFAFISLTSCSKKIQLLNVASFDKHEKQDEIPGYLRVCNEPINYAPDSFTETRTVRVNVHLLNNKKGNANFSLVEGEKYYRTMLFNANERLGRNKKMNLPVGNNTPVLDPSYRYKIFGVTTGDSGCYSHKDEDHYYFMNKGKRKNNYKREVVKKYAIKLDSILNIFAISHPQDSLKSKKYKAVGTGIALGNALKISGMFSNKKSKPWDFATLLNHEIGHVLGLAHSWTKYDGCDDTPVHPNCWSKHSPPPCDGTHSNNVMDYNNSQMAYTPCQIGKIHKSFNKLGSRTRGLLVEDWCTADTTQAIIIAETYEWKGDRDLDKDIIITEGGKLILHCRLSMANDRSITIKPGGELHIHSHTHLHNSCGGEWKGIILESKKSTAKQLFLYGHPKIEDVTKEKTLQTSS